MHDILKSIYNKVNGVNFNFKNFENKLTLQKTVYILMNMGVNIGEYSFEWREYGPYSVVLDADSFNLKQNKNKIESDTVQFSDIALAKMNKLVNYIKEGKERFGDVYSKRE